MMHISASSLSNIENKKDDFQVHLFLFQNNVNFHFCSTLI